MRRALRARFVVRRPYGRAGRECTVDARPSPAHSVARAAPTRDPRNEARLEPLRVLPAGMPHEGLLASSSRSGPVQVGRNGYLVAAQIANAVTIHRGGFPPTRLASADHPWLGLVIGKLLVIAAPEYVASAPPPMTTLLELGYRRIAPRFGGPQNVRSCQFFLLVLSRSIVSRAVQRGNGQYAIAPRR